MNLSQVQLPKFRLSNIEYQSVKKNFEKIVNSKTSKKIIKNRFFFNYLWIYKTRKLNRKLAKTNSELKEKNKRLEKSNIGMKEEILNYHNKIDFYKNLVDEKDQQLDYSKKQNEVLQERMKNLESQLAKYQQIEKIDLLEVSY